MNSSESKTGHTRNTRADRIKKSRPKITLIVETSFASGRNIIQGITSYARQHGPWIFHHEWRNTDQIYPEWLGGWNGDGIIARVENTRIAKDLHQLNVPVVDVLGTVEDSGFPLVHVEDTSISKLAADHLLDRGFRHFAFCGFKHPNWSIRRRDAFLQYLRTQGCSAEVFLWSVDEDKGAGRLEKELTRLRRWLGEQAKPLGVMACNDLLGELVLQACRHEDIAVPDEVAVIGVDNDETICEVTDPPLSSIIPDDERVGYDAARLLDAMLKQEAGKEEVMYVSPRGVCPRLSTDSLAVEDLTVAAAVHFIREHAREGITVADVVKAVPVSRSLLQRQFKAALGKTLHDEIVSVRLDHARFLLEEGNMQLSVVAEKSGFKHQEYMGAVFKKMMKQTPLEYRKKHKIST